MPAPQTAPAASPAALPLPAAPGSAPLTASMPAPASRTTKPKRPYVPGLMQVQVGGNGQTAPRKMYPIRQALNRQRDLKDGPIRLLIEVCEIYENGGRRSCYATNSSLGEILGRGKTQISKWLDYLERAGWLHLEHHPEQGNTRLLIPSEQARRCYGAQEAETGHPPIAESATPPPKVKVEKNRKPRPAPKDETATPPVAESATPVLDTATGVLETATLDYQQSTSRIPTASFSAGEGLDFQKKIGGVNAAQAPAPPPAPLPPLPPLAPPQGATPTPEFIINKYLGGRGVCTTFVAEQTNFWFWKKTASTTAPTATGSTEPAAKSTTADPATASASRWLSAAQLPQTLLGDIARQLLTNTSPETYQLEHLSASCTNAASEPQWSTQPPAPSAAATDSEREEFCCLIASPGSPLTIWVGNASFAQSPATTPGSSTLTIKSLARLEGTIQQEISRCYAPTATSESLSPKAATPEPAPAPAATWPAYTGPPQPPTGPGPDEKPRQGSEASRAMTARLAAYFGVNEVAHSGHYAELGRFCRYVEGQGTAAYLAKQFAAYVAQKKLTGQSIGSWTNYIAAGTETFAGGKWNMHCWVHKLAQDLEDPRNQATARAQGPEAIQQYLALVPAASAYFTSTTPTHAAAANLRPAYGKPGAGKPTAYAFGKTNFDLDD